MELPFEISVLLLGMCAFLIACASAGYARSGDILHPAIFLAFLFFAGMVVEPWQRLSHPKIELFFPEFKGVAGSLLIQYLGIIALFLGVLSVDVPRKMRSHTRDLIDSGLDRQQKKQVQVLAWILGLVAIGAFWYGVFNVGGISKAYGYAKGGGRSASGYLGEAQNLGFAAVVMYALANQGRKGLWGSLLIMVLFVSPTLLHGTLGGRRGPLFISLVALFAGWCVLRGRMPRLVTLFGFLAATLTAVVFVQSQRRHLHLGSDDASIDLGRFQSVIKAEEIQSGDNFFSSTGLVQVAKETGKYHNGRRFLIIFGIRPVPRQLWPTKYHDMSALLYGVEGDYYEAIKIHSRTDWIRTVGWMPPQGYAINVMADLFMEFSWGFLLAAALLGRGIGMIWLRFRLRGGIWTILFLASAVLSIYLPTQSFSAFAHRFLFISVGTWVFWKIFVKPKPKRRMISPLRIEEEDQVSQAGEVAR